MVAPLAQHACLPAGEDEGGGQETSGGPTAETQAASGGGRGSQTDPVSRDGLCLEEKHEEISD